MAEQELLTQRRQNRLERALRVTTNRLTWTGQLTFQQARTIRDNAKAWAQLVDTVSEIAPQALTDEGEGDVPGFPLLSWMWQHRAEILEFILELLKLFGGI